MKYAEEGGSQIEVEVNAIQALGMKVIRGDYLEEVAGFAWVARDLLQLATPEMAPKRLIADDYSTIRCQDKLWVWPTF